MSPTPKSLFTKTFMANPIKRMGNIPANARGYSGPDVALKLDTVSRVGAGLGGSDGIFSMGISGHERW